MYFLLVAIFILENMHMQLSCVYAYTYFPPEHPAKHFHNSICIITPNFHSKSFKAWRRALHDADIVIIRGEGHAIFTWERTPRCLKIN